MQTSYLLSKSKVFDKSMMDTVQYQYDSNTSLNMVTKNNISTIAVQSAGLSPTHSKTMAAPGDDDPDHERCY